MNDRELIENFIKTARAIAQISDDSHFEIEFTDSNDKKQVIKVDVLNEDGTTEVEDKHHNECMQLARYSDENRKLKELLRRVIKLYRNKSSEPMIYLSGIVIDAEELVEETFPAIDCDYYSPSDRKCTYGEEEDWCAEGPWWVKQVKCRIPKPINYFF